MQSIFSQSVDLVMYPTMINEIFYLENNVPL